MARRFMVMKRYGSGGLLVSGVALVLTLVTLLYVPAAHAQAEGVQAGSDVEPMVFTPPARVDAIQQGTNFGGVTFVRLVGVACPGRSDGFFILPSSSKQLLELEVLLLALDRGFRARLDYNPSTCVAAAVSVCATGSPC